MKTDILNRDDIDKLIRLFYLKARKDELLGPIFSASVKTEEAWEAHFITITDFWEANLFFNPVYSGNPITAHNRADAASSHSISMDHFGKWLNIWFETIDANFEGQKAELAKSRARNMSTMLYMKMYEARK